jgi:TrpR-related protein YerC/YecD
MPKHSKSDHSPNLQNLYEAFAVLETADEAACFLQDLCTPQELDAIAQRYQIAKLLSEDRRYADIVSETGTSTATISRVNRSLSSRVSSGGYEIVFARLKAKAENGEENK